MKKPKIVQVQVIQDGIVYLLDDGRVFQKVIRLQTYPSGNAEMASSWRWYSVVEEITPTFPFLN